jgi:hypothetical protein
MLWASTELLNPVTWGEASKSIEGLRGGGGGGVGGGGGGWGGGGGGYSLDPLDFELDPLDVERSVGVRGEGRERGGPGEGRGESAVALEKRGPRRVHARDCVCVGGGG